MFAYKTWATCRQVKTNLMITEIWFLIKMQRIPWMDRKVNEAVLQEVDRKHKLINEVI